MSKITVSYAEQVVQFKDVDVPAYLVNAGIYFKVISANTCIQVITTNDPLIKKWVGATTITRLFSDNTYAVCSESDFTQAFQTALAALSI